MQFVFFILFFKQFDAFENVFSKCFNKFDVQHVDKSDSVSAIFPIYFI